MTSVRSQNIQFIQTFSYKVSEISTKLTRLVEFSISAEWRITLNVNLAKLVTVVLNPQRCAIRALARRFFLPLTPPLDSAQTQTLVGSVFCFPAPCFYTGMNQNIPNVNDLVMSHNLNSKKIKTKLMKFTLCFYFILFN